MPETLAIKINSSNLNLQYITANDRLCECCAAQRLINICDGGKIKIWCTVEGFAESWGWTNDEVKALIKRFEEQGFITLEAK